MKLGLCSAILPDQSLEQVVKFAAQTGYECVELMCWPVGKAERRYAGVTHIDVVGLKKSEVGRIQDLLDAVCALFRLASARSFFGSLRHGALISSSGRQV